jgi:hypothetical protein
VGEASVGWGVGASVGEDVVHDPKLFVSKYPNSPPIASSSPY